MTLTLVYSRDKIAKHASPPFFVPNPGTLWRELLRQSKDEKYKHIPFADLEWYSIAEWDDETEVLMKTDSTLVIRGSDLLVKPLPDNDAANMD